MKILSNTKTAKEALCYPPFDFSAMKRMYHEKTCEELV